LTVGGNANLQGGQLRFWIGEWSDPDGEGPLGPLYSFYYYNAKALAVADGWNLRSVKVTPDDGAWTEISDNQDKSAADLFVNPQQWGIGLVGATAAPTGLLGFDEFATIVPEPGTLALAALAALAWLQRPRPGRRPRR